MRYARTNYGITTMLPNKCILDIIIKENDNLIYLIEKEDYVNGERVVDVLLDGKMSRVKTAEGSTFFNNDIEWVITHEKIEREKFKVGE